MDDFTKPEEGRAPEYDRNLLESCANWLEGHKYTVWAKEFGHTGLMETYARDLRAIRERLPAAVPNTEPPPTRFRPCLHCDAPPGHVHAQTCPTRGINGLPRLAGFDMGGGAA